MHKILFVILVLVNSSAVAMADPASPLETFTAILNTQKDHPLRLEVKKLETSVVTHQSELQLLKQQAEAFQTEVSSMKAEIGFREKYLWSWVAEIVGGRHTKIFNL